MDGKTIALGALGIGAVGFIVYRLSRPVQPTVVQGGGGGPSPQEMTQLAQQAQAPALQAVSSLQEGILGLAKQYQQESASTKTAISQMQQQTAQMIAAQTQTFSQALEKIANMQTTLGDKMAQQIASVISSQQQFQQQLVSQLQQGATNSSDILNGVISSFGQIIGAVMANQVPTQPVPTRPVTMQPAQNSGRTVKPWTFEQIAPGAVTTSPYSGSTVTKAVTSDAQKAIFNISGQTFVLDKNTGTVTNNGQIVAQTKNLEWGIQEVLDTSGKRLGYLDTSTYTYIAKTAP